MPDLSPSLSLLRRMGLSAPPPQGSSAPTMSRDDYDAMVRILQSHDPAWKQNARAGIDIGANVVKGLLGKDPDPNESNAGYVANVLSQLGGAAHPFTEAGLPLLALTKDQPIFHGTTSAFEKFDPSRYDKTDVLGWMTHGTPDQNYADAYAQGMKGNRGGREVMIAMKPKAQNTLDLINPNNDDLSAAVAALPEYKRQNAISRYKAAINNPDDYRDILAQTKHFTPKEIANIPNDQIANQWLAEMLRMEPEDLNRSHFDAIRYRDVDKEAYAIKPGTPIESFSGAPMTHDPTPLTVTKLPEHYIDTAPATLDPNRWANTPMNLPEIPLPEFHKGNMTPEEENYYMEMIHGLPPLNNITPSTFSTNSDVFQNMYNAGKNNPHSITDLPPELDSSSFIPPGLNDTNHPFHKQLQDLHYNKKPMTDEDFKNYMNYEYPAPDTNNANNPNYIDGWHMKYSPDEILNMVNPGDKLTMTYPNLPGTDTMDYILGTKFDPNIKLDKNDNAVISPNYLKVKLNSGYQFDMPTIENIESNKPTGWEMPEPTTEPVAHFPNFGPLTKTEAGQLVNGGEITMSQYQNAFGYGDN